MSDKRPIIVVKKVKKVAGGHHGGSWKVAYADFVTAMMAFFLVMWILGMDQPTREGIGEYFSNPMGVRAGMAAGANPMMSGPAPGVKIIGTAGERERLKQLGERIEERLNEAGLSDLDAQVEITVTEEGLRIELLESMHGEPFFASGSPRLQDKARSVLEVVSGELARSTYEVVLEGHTDAATYQTPGYTNWELSGDRANAARRVLERGGVRPEKVVSVRGFADRALRVPSDPLHPSNRRISILLPFRSVSAPDAEPEAVAEVAAEQVADLSEH